MVTPPNKRQTQHPPLHLLSWEEIGSHCPPWMNAGVAALINNQALSEHRESVREGGRGNFGGFPAEIKRFQHYLNHLEVTWSCEILKGKEPSVKNGQEGGWCVGRS